MARYDDELIREIEARTDIVEVIGQVVDLTRRGNRYWGICPFHGEKTPSFSVSQERQLYYCFGCHAGGNVFGFVMKQQGLEFIEAVEYLAQRAGVSLEGVRGGRSKAKRDMNRAIMDANQEAALFYRQRLIGPEGQKAREYLRQRGISDETAERFGLGYAPNDWRLLAEHLLRKGFPSQALVESGLIRRSQRGDSYIDFQRNRLIFPIYNNAGRVIGFGGRLLDGDGPKYLNSPETMVFSKRFNLFGLYHGRDSIRDSNQVMLVEGYMDCIQLHQHGVANAVATLGTALTADQARLIKRTAQEVVIIYDGDEAGQRETMRAIEVLQEEGLNPWSVTLPENLDPDDFIRKQGKEEFLKFVQNNRCTAFEFKLEKRIKSSPVESWEQKLLILREMFPDAARINSIMLRENMLAQAALRLEIPERMVRQEFRVWVKERRTVGSIRNRNSGIRNNKKHAEKDDNTLNKERLLAKMINDPRQYEEITERLGENSFQEHHFAKMLEMFALAKKADQPDEVLRRFREAVNRDEELAPLWARVSLLEEAEPLAGRELDEVIRSVRLERENREWHGLLEEIKGLENEGDFWDALRCVVRLGGMNKPGQEGGIT